jgi:hypothetical protein
MDINLFPNISRFVRNSVSDEECNHWEMRRPLPVARGKVELTSLERSKSIVSALLVVSGLGSFASTFNGMALSSSSVLDPPTTDFTQRVSYRGYDVTKHFKGFPTYHVVGITLGSAWWDARPLMGRVIKFFVIPRGPLTTIAELHLIFDDGSTAVKIPSGTNEWQMAKGFILDSDLFTGDTFDMETLRAMKDWDSPEGWEDIGGNKMVDVEWVQPALYRSDIETSAWRRALSEKSGAIESVGRPNVFAIAPIGKLVPVETPPVMPIERLPPESVVSLGNGRWLLDFGKAVSGVLRFDNGLPNPIVPKSGYARAHNFLGDGTESFITVVYGESLQIETGDINLNLVAGMGLHNTGTKQSSEEKKREGKSAGGPCYPKDHGKALTQRDVFVSPKNRPGSFAEVRQSMFTSHGFRFAELCCVEELPEKVHAVAYRTAFVDWGKFDSSNILLNGAYELAKNALNSNMLGAQTDCPHREKLQYGGDLVATSPAAMHFFDLSAFYAKIIHDWTDTQWNNGAYTETSIWQDLNDDRGIGHGAGETVWAALPPVLTVRHMQHYADDKLAEETFDHHVRWLEFLKANWKVGMHNLFYKHLGKDFLRNYKGGTGGLSDWGAIRTRDTWLTHNAFYMASARAIGYLAARLEGSTNYSEIGTSALTLAYKIKGDINALYMNNNDFRMRKNAEWTPGPEMGLYARIVPVKERCTVLKKWAQQVGSEEIVTWPGDEEQRFFRRLNKKDLDEMIKHEKVRRNGMNERGEERFQTMWRSRHNTPEGILALRYSLNALSDMGLHNIALSKVTGDGFPSFEYMLSHNATTMWESWWRSEDVYSRNHPMLAAVSEWAVSTVAGISLAPTTNGGRELLFWPRVPKSAITVQHASASQGTKRGDAAIAWEFLGLPQNETLLDSAVVKVHIRILVPPSSVAILSLPAYGKRISMKYAEEMPDLEKTKSSADNECARRRSARMGFHYNWEYDREKQQWRKFYNQKTIGTPCQSYLFRGEVSQAKWSPPKLIRFKQSENDTEVDVDSGLYDVIIDHWQLGKESEGKPRCDTSSSEGHWNVNDATHLI